MTKSELIKQLASSHRMPHRRAREIVEVIFSSMTENLGKGDKIEIRGFGSFSVKQYDKRMSRNPKTGESIQVPPKRAVSFKAGKALRELVNTKEAMN